jgi:competence protein CoiA
LKYSLVNNIRSLPAKGLSGVCSGCESATRAYCGERYVHHWKHLSTEDCDPWYEPITEWHIDWQNRFPEDWQEQVIKKEGGHHRADVLTEKGIVIEFQNSPITYAEAAKRESFYGKMIWVLNGANFKKSFNIAMDKPDNWDREFDPHGTYPKLRPYFVRSNLVDASSPRIRRAENIFNLKFLGRPTLKNKSVYFWTHSRHTWLKCEKPIFIDFHDDYLWWLKPMATVQRVAKEEFINKYRPNADVEKL